MGRPDVLPCSPHANFKPSQLHPIVVVLLCFCHEPRRCACRGYFSVNASLANADGMLPDTYINVGKYDWAKGVAFINGFNLVRLQLPHNCTIKKDTLLDQALTIIFNFLSLPPYLLGHEGHP